MITLAKIRKSDNLTDEFDEQELAKIAHQVIKGYDIDDESRESWKTTVNDAMDIAKQLMCKKDYPWPNASNVKFPLITMAAIDYAARTLPEVIPNGNLVKVNVVGADNDGSKLARGNRVAQYMSYQLIQDSPDWEDGTDKLLQVLPVVGTVFKKTYQSPTESRCISELCLPDKIVVNYNSQSMESARRVTHIIELYPNDIVTRQRNGLFNKDIDIDWLRPTTESPDDEDFQINLLEQHCWLDLDEDGYKEPYIVTVHKESGKVLRIVDRIKEIKRNKDKEVSEIIPVDYFTDYHFIRSPDGGFYSLGFGALLLPLNSAVNTIINQLIDAGTLSNMQGGFLGRGIRLKQGEFKVRMGEWKQLDAAAGTNLAQNIVSIPTKEPSQVLFSLLGMLIQIGKDLSSTTDVLKGKQPAQNVASGTINTLVEQGTKVFTAINKRVYRSLKKEYMKIYELNAYYLSDKQYQTVLDDPEVTVKADFNEDSRDIYPVADPTMSSVAQRVSRAQILSQMRTVDPRAADRYLLESMQLDKTQIEALQPPKDPNEPPPPEVQEIMAKIELIKAQIQQITSTLGQEQMEMMVKLEKAKQDVLESQARVQESAARAWKMQKDALHNDQKIQITATKMQSEQSLKGASAQQSQLIDGVNANLAAAELKVKQDKNQTDAEVAMAKIQADLMKESNKPKKEPK